MFGTGLLAGLIAKLAGLGSAAKVAVATAAALTMTGAGAAAVVLPAETGHSPAAITQGVIDEAVTGAVSVVPTTSGETAVEAGGEASVAAPNVLPSATADASAGIKTPAAATAALPVPTDLIPGAAVPDLSALTHIPAQVLSCLAPVFELVTALPSVSPAQISQIGPTVVSCVTGIVEGLPLPFGMNACVSEILGFVSTMTSQMPTVMPSFGGFNIATCIPTGLPVPTGFSGGLPFMGGESPFGMGAGFSFGR